MAKTITVGPLWIVPAIDIDREERDQALERQAKAIRRSAARAAARRARRVAR